MEPKTGLTLEESMKEVMKTLPPFIRDYLLQGKYTAVAQGLMSKYKLRIDQGGILERELLLLLMGVENPAEFTKALAEEAKLDQLTVNALVRDINDQVFVPLRKEEENLTKNTPQQPKPVTPQAPVRPVSPTPQQRAEPTPPPHIAPLPPKTAMPRPTGLGDVLRSVMAPKPMPNDRLLEDHEEPHIELKGTPPARPTDQEPKESMPVKDAISSVPPVAPMPSAPRPIVPPTTEQPQAPKTPPVPPITSYTKDPYREPLDEDGDK